LGQLQQVYFGIEPKETLGMVKQLDNKPLTLEDIQKLVEELEPKTIYVNKKTFDLMLEKIDFKPTNVVVNNFIPDNQAIVMTETQKENMNKGFFPHKVW
jgi:hypothetical protein